MRKRWRWVGLILAAALLFTLTGCGKGPKPVKNKAGETVFRLGFPGSADTLNPYTAMTREAAAVLGLIYDPLFIRDPESGEYKGWLCQEWTVASAASEGAVLWKLTLRNDVSWHDGKPLTARDVEFSLQSLKDFSALWGYPDCEWIDTTGIAVEDDTHLAFLVWGDAPYILECLSHVPILPRHVWNATAGMEYDSSGVPRSYALASRTIGSAPINKSTMIGSGPYRWESWEDSVCTLRRNEAYWNGSGLVQVVEFRFNCENPAAMLREKELDAAWGLSAADEQLLEKKTRCSLASGTEGELYWLLFDHRAETGPSLLRSENIRKAMDLCLDREDLLLRSFGDGIPSLGLLSSGSPWYYEADLESRRTPSADSANWLLDSAGYTARDEDGIRMAGNGERLSFELLCSDAAPAWQRLAEGIRDSLAQAGIGVEILRLSPEELLRRMEEGSFELALAGVNVYEDPFASLGTFAWDNGANSFAVFTVHGDTARPGWNITGYRDAEFDRLYALSLGQEGAARRETILQMGQRLYDAAAVLPLGFAEERQALRSNWRNLTPEPGSGLFFTVYSLRTHLLSFAENK